MGSNILGRHLQIELVIPQGRFELLLRLGLPRSVQHEGRLPLRLEGMDQNDRQTQYGKTNQACQQESEVDRAFHVHSFNLSII